MRSYERIVKAVGETPWAMRPEVLTVILDLLAFRASGGKLTDEEIRARIGGDVERAEPRRAGAVAVIPLSGPIFPKANMLTAMSGATSLEVFRGQFREALADEKAESIVLDINSPGGMVDMVPETFEEIFAARGQKPIVAVANVDANSAAYFIGVAAAEFIVTPSGSVGSVGVWHAHEDWSKHDEAFGVKTTLVSAGKFKVEGNPFEPLGDEAREALQATVDDYYEMFVTAVAKGRGTTVQAVRSGFGEGRVVLAADALAAGMVDQVATLDDTIRRLGGRVGPAVQVDEDDDEIIPPPEGPEAKLKPVRSDAFVRSMPVDDISIRRDGRTVEAYSAVFETPARVTDWYYVKDNPFDDEFGTYKEILKPRVFEKSLRERGTDFQVMFNHGRDIFGRPLERFAMPLAVPIEVRADGHGLVTVYRIAKTELGDEVLELITEGAIRAQSFSGRPMQTRVVRGKAGEPDTLERVEIALREFGPAIFPVYNGAEIVGVRAEALAHQMAYLPPEERARLALILQGTPVQAARPGTDRREPPAADTSNGAGNTPPQTGPSLDVLLLEQEQRRRHAGI